MNSNENTKRLTPEYCAERMGCSVQFVRIGIQRGILPFGVAIKVGGNRYTYHIPPEQFWAYMGVRRCDPTIQ